MLVQLYIQNYAIIEELKLQLGPQLTIITGETGAGKSILTGALSLIQGQRADTKVLYDPDQKCIVEATYQNTDQRVHELLKREDIEIEEELIIRRLISPNGKSRAFVNDEPVNLGVLRELNDYLIDMHRQFDTLGINNENVQISMLDAMVGHANLIDSYQQIYKLYRKNVNKLNSLTQEEYKINQELEFLLFQMSELQETSFQEGEQTELEEELNLLENAESLTSILQKINYSLYDRPNSITSELDEIYAEFSQIKGLNTELQDIVDRLQSCREELVDIASTSDRMSGNFDIDKSELEAKQEKLSTLYRLLRKHNKEDLSELLSFQADLKSKIKELQNFSQDKTALEKTIASQTTELKALSSAISKSRKEKAPEFSKQVKAILAQLGMEHAIFEIEIQEGTEFRSNGWDHIQFLFSANPGKSPQAISEVASGGELSRLALSLKSIVADNYELPTLIFDEIDSGVSGDVAGKMGIILKDISRNHQLISITHSPQIAAKADHHFFVYKEVKNQRTYTKIKKLDAEERIIEIAKMLSGDPPPQTALENAKALIN